MLVAMTTLRRVTIPLLVFGVLLIAMPMVNGGELLTMAVSPVQSIAPTTVRVRIRVEPRAENRVLEVAADSGNYYRGSTIPLDGDLAPATVTLSYPNLPEGSYEVVCVLIDNTGHRRATARAKLSVTPML